MDTDARFCWTELTASDPEQAGKFYGRLLGWQRDRQVFRTPSGRSIEYTLLSLGGHNVGGMHALLRGQRLQGIQSCWLPYVFVADARRAGQRAEELGARILAPPAGVMDLGRLSILRDPQGVLFGTWEPMRLGAGFQTRDLPGFSCWFEHVSEDASGATRFYGELFDWSRGALDLGGAAQAVLECGGRPVAGFSARATSPGKPAAQWLTYFRVEDCAASCRTLAAQQGTVLVAPFEAPGVGRFALAGDPGGAPFGLLQPAPRP